MNELNWDINQTSARAKEAKFISRSYICTGIFPSLTLAVVRSFRDIRKYHQLAWWMTYLKKKQPYPHAQEPL